MSDKEVFTRKEASNLIKQAKKQGALKELKQLVDLIKFNQKGKIGFWSVEVWIKNIEKRIKELERGKTL